MTRMKQTPLSRFGGKEAASHQGTQPPAALQTRYRSSVRRYQNPQSHIRKADPHAESVDHPVDRSAIPNLLVPISDRFALPKMGLLVSLIYSMSLVLGYIAERLIYAGLNLKNMAFLL